MRFEVKSIKPKEFKTDLAIVGVFSDGILGVTARALNKASNGLISDALENGDIDGKIGSVLLLPTPHLICKRILLVGCGHRDQLNRKAFRKALKSSYSWLKNKPYSQISLYLGLEKIRGANAQQIGLISASTWLDIFYSFTQMKSEKIKKSNTPDSITIAGSMANKSALRKGVKIGKALGVGIAFSRDLANLPGNICTPSYLAKEARALAKKNARLSCKVLNESDMQKLAMGSMLSVTAGSKEPAKFIELNYQGAAKNKPPVVLIGKGITFDTGGISLKPPSAMDEMKFDMCGAASVMGTFKSLTELNPNQNVIGLIPTCENMPGSNATKPGDIVKSMSGQTIEVLNTDAEGRLILCDALTYSRIFNPAAVIDIATLTGACVIALGKHYSGLLSSSDKLAKKLIAAGNYADDPAWRLPLGEEYSAQLKSNFADIANIGGRDAGTITAACFLEKFTDKMNWAHLDIAGTAYRTGPMKGSTGRPVPLLFEYLLHHR
ncbi:MAG: leucyl aminopeptidase [Pseudomonadota bacterium]|nr:leucyl aminopeptidase [Pseudomonadota bacterium]